MSHDKITQERQTTWPEELELELTGIAQGGDAVGRHDNCAVFVAGGLPGEHVRARLYDRQRSFARGRASKILQAAPERVPSFCPFEAMCSAGDWRWIAYEAQLRFKAEILRDQLRHLGGMEVEVAMPATPDTPALAYRTTAELHVDRGQIGYYRPGSRRVADLQACCLHHPLINGALASLRPLLSERTKLRSVTIRCSPSTDRTIGVCNGKGDLQSLAQRWMKAEPSLVGVAGTDGSVLAGENVLLHEVGGIQFEISAGSFFQINYLQWEPLVTRVRKLLDLQPNTRLLDLYCGAGLFALTLARDVESVLGIEAWQPAISDAERSAERNNIHDAEFVAGNAEQVLSSIDWHFDRAVLDPPRRGCDPAVINALLAYQPQRIVYVSCHPGTLARDCKQLVQAGYRLGSAEIIDMFPHTSHVESIVMLEQ